MIRVTASLIGLLIVAPLSAQEPLGEPLERPVEEQHEHVVREGDTLWDLAGSYYNDPFQWRAIYEANRDVLSNPHRISPDEVLTIPGTRARTAARPDGGAVTVARQPVDRPNRTVFYREPPPRPQSEGDATILSEPEMTGTPVRPGEFTAAPYLYDPDQLEVKGVFMRPIRVDRERADIGSSAHPQDRVYLAYADGERPAVGDRLAVVDVGEGMSGARENLRIIRPRGIVRILGLGSDVIEARIEAQYGPIFPEQPVVPLAMFPDFVVESAEPVETGYDLEGEILDFVEDQPMYGPTAQAIINLGRQHGVQEGDIFEAYLPRRSVETEDMEDFGAGVEELPPEVVAQLRVVRVMDDHATVKAEDVRLSTLGPDLPVRRIRRIP